MMTGKSLKVAGAQIPVLGDVEANYESISMALEQAIEQEADILLTPEGSLSGYFPQIDQEKVDDFLEKIVEKASGAGVGLALGTCFREKDDEGVYNQLRFYGKDGTFLGFHSKMTKTTGEFDDYKSSPLRTFEFEGITMGGLICNDIWANPGCTLETYPHYLVQKLSKMGAKVIFHAVNGGRSKDPFMEVVHAYHESNLRMRAQANKVWIVTVDNCFPFNVPCSAPSGVISPDGNWTVKIPNLNDQVFTYTIKIEE
ncbi:MAG: carbon-nitrogen hydrolase family protein [Candidatus Hodarchaeota archaeon]